ncbi:MAG TPA: COX15/CtaA family protein [Myxococcota bacterium]|nr:COX15/CtaA family protein [Myxococcota bacterium]
MASSGTEAAAIVAAECISYPKRVRARSTLEEGEAARDARFLTHLSHAYVALVALTAGQLVLGALVRAHGAGLACPDWPLCFGTLIPQLDFRVAFEFGHRVTGGIVSLLFVGLSAIGLASPKTRRWTARWTAAAGLLLTLQVVLGGLTVLHLLESWTVTAHLVTGNLFAATLLVIQQRLSDAAARARGMGSAAEPGKAPLRRGLRPAIAAAGGLLALQVLLGGVVSSRYAGLACLEWPTCIGGVFFPSFEGTQGLHLLHRTNGYLLLTTLALCAFLARREPRLARLTALAALVGLLQVGLGIANVLLRLPVEVTALHSAGAAGLILLWTAAAVRAFAPGARDTRPQRNAALLLEARG